MKQQLSQALAWLRASPWASLALRCAGSVALVIALAVVGSLPLARAQVLSPQAPGALSPSCPEPAQAPAPQARAPTLAAPAAAASPPSAPASAMVVLNSATAVELDSLPGVGAKRAEAILTLRQRLGGRFRRVEDLLRVKGIGPASLRRIKPLVLLDAPPPPKSAPAEHISVP